MQKTLIPNIKAMALHETFIFVVAAVATIFNKALAQNTLPVDKIYFPKREDIQFRDNNFFLCHNPLEPY